ncbi:hemerythrin HHE cation binding domain-containing [Pyrenophora seminiperda CCB06]|uniref:Hemerythrin HHE cation binding domain-containing n=1 Tax=Pyrenophora seminiperda CCB06 TaxID=1302712 RepID=A0A3M7M8F3_9PLEO|nr:hemerythrin HHE cation binding domain-containing [Pyrenophora seminiperda CCB06]
MVEYLNFVSYCLATYQCLLTQLGSTFEKEGENKTLAEWGNWIEPCSARRNNFSTDMCKSMMDEFMPALHNQLSTYHNGESGKMSLDSNTQLPIFWTNHDITLEHELPRGLAPESKAMRWWTARKKAEWWKFSTCGIHGLPRELKFYREM